MKAKEWNPVFIENSRIPVFLSKFAPINIWAISFGFWVWCKGEMTPKTKRHETIHFQQQLELLFVLQWLLYGLFYIKGLIQYRNGERAYRESPFEREAYRMEGDEEYLKSRPRYSWVKHILN